MIWGGLGGGHYTAFAKNFVDHQWYEYNDSSVSKQSDPSRVVSQSAYPLFYRRRSDEPLGGPRFKQIFHDFENPPEPSEDEVSESGEDQGLAANSSLHWSSSALTGVGAAHRQPSPGLEDDGQMITVNPLVLESGPPPYDAREIDDDDGASLIVRDVEMNDGLPLHDSIEDEGIDMSMGYNNINIVNNGVNYGAGILSSWNFDGLGRNTRAKNRISVTGSDVDGDDHIQSLMAVAILGSTIP